MKIIKLLQFVFFVNLVHAADLPEDHPIKTAVQMAKLAFVQHPNKPGMNYGGMAVRTPIEYVRENLSHIQSNTINNCKNTVDLLFLNDELKYIALFSVQLSSSINIHYYPHMIGHQFYFNIEAAINAITLELNTYINQSFEHHFNTRMEDQKFASAYKLALVYRDANTAHEENTAKATAWIAEIEKKATTEITKLSRTVTALIGVPDLELDYRTRVLEIINSFPIGSQLHIDFQTCFDEIFFEPRVVPDASRLTLQREMADRLFS